MTEIAQASNCMGDRVLESVFFLAECSNVCLERKNRRIKGRNYGRQAVLGGLCRGGFTEELSKEIRTDLAFCEWPDK
jgi:hypothetical protein